MGRTASSRSCCPTAKTRWTFGAASWGATTPSPCRTHGLALVFLLAPTSTPERIAAVVSHATGFVYLVSLAGVTGARDQLPPDLAALVNRVRGAIGLPLAVGFDIATLEHAAAVGVLADGVIVGSALIKAAAATADPAAAAGRFVRSLREALAP
jgi:tryptophan synthase alpha chain